MSRQVNGMHVSNFRHWFVEQLHQTAYPDGAVTLLHFLMRDDTTIQQWSDRENINWYIKLRHGWAPQGIPAAPERLIHVRMYHPHWSSRSAQEWAQHTVDMLSHIEASDVNGNVYGVFNLWTDPYVTVSPANEQNLHYENGDPDAGNQWKYRTVEHYVNIAHWNAEWAREVKRLVPNRQATLTWPAFAYGHDPVAKLMDGTPVAVWRPHELPDGEYTIPAVRRAIAEYEIMATHPYGHLNWADPAGTRTVTWGEKDAYFHLYRDFRPKGYDKPSDPGGALVQLPGRPILVSESGTFAHSDHGKTAQNAAVMQEFLRRAAESKRILGVTWFIWSTNDAHQENNVMLNGDLREAIVALPKFRTTLAVPTTGPIVDPGQPPDEQRDEWVLSEAEALQLRAGLRINAQSALMRESGVVPENWVPTTNEHSAIYAGDGQSYTLQRFEVPATNEVKVVYFQTGVWDQPHVARRGVIPQHQRDGFGIDVSHHNGAVDWQRAAAAEVDFAFIKATEGWSFVDPRFEENAAGSQGVIRLRAPYHYYSNSARKPVSQAKHFLATIEAFDWELPPVVDIEDTTAPFRSAEFREFLDKVEELAEVRPMLYTARWYVEGHTRALGDYANRYWQWVASYTTEILVPDGWQNVVVWQYTSRGDGPAHGTTRTHVDLNRTLKPYKLSDLAKLRTREPGVM